MNLLNHYWQIYPEIIIRSNSIILKISQDFTSIELIKNMYALFNKILPCKNLRILSLINHSLSGTFHKIMNLDKSSVLNQEGFNIVYHMLKSGMTSLCNYNKYIFYGLLFPSRRVNQIAVKIIKEIYLQ
jgi:hypothetical protein